MKIQNILLLLALTMVVSITSASAAEINLCAKAVNISNSWGVCSEPAQGTLTYNAAGTQMDNTATASGLTAGVNYTLIYYKDVDPAHIAPTDKTINVLGTGVADASGNIVISAPAWVGGDIPATNDINPRGKIWIVPTSEIKGDGTLRWTGYGNGLTMAGYLFESDSIAQTPGDGYTVQERMGGITYKSVSEASVLTQVSAQLGDLFRIVITPHVATVIPTGSQQFTAVGTDEGGLELTNLTTPAFVQIWSIESQGQLEVDTNIDVNNGLLFVARYETAKDIDVIVTDFSSSITKRATVSIPEVRSISADVSSVDFGSVQRGKTSDPVTVIIYNEGNVDATAYMVPSVLTGTNPLNTIPGSSIDATPVFPVDVPYTSDVSTDLTLTIPVDAPLDTYSGTIEFSTLEPEV